MAEKPINSSSEGEVTARLEVRAADPTTGSLDPPDGDPTPLELRSLPPYEILEQIGSGGMGSVYRALHTTLGREVALKLMSPGCLREIEMLARFKREMTVAASLNHLNVVKILDGGEIGGVPFLAMELLHGESLDDVAQHCAPMKPDQVVALGSQMADALVYLHERNILHRDIKPSNLILTKDGVLKVLDFGLVWKAEATALTAPDTWMGTLSYLAPELMSGTPPTAMSDLWSAGCVLYMMVTGTPAFQDPDTRKLVYKIQHEPTQFPETLVPASPEPLRRLILSLLEKDPAKRLGTAKLLQRKLREVADISPPSATVGFERSGQQAGPSESTSHPRWKNIIRSLGFVALIASLAGLPFWWQNRNSDAILQAGILLQSNFDWKGARTQYIRYLALQPSDATAHYLMTVVDADNVSEATRHARAAIAAAPDAVEPRYALGLALFRGNALPEAEKQLRAALEESSSRPLAERYITPYLVRGPLAVRDSYRTRFQSMVHQELGLVLVARKQESAAESQLRTAIAVDPNNAYALLELGTLLGRQNRLVDAEQILRKCVQMPVVPAGAPIVLGEVLERNSRKAEAAQQYRSSLRLAPGGLQASLMLARILMANREYTEMDEVLRTAIASNPKYDELRYLHSTCLYGMGKPSAAIAALNSVIEREPFNAEARLRMGDLYLDLGRPADAEVHLRDALAAKPNDPDRLNRLALALMRQRKLEEAERLCERSIHIDPDRSGTAQRILELEALKHFDAK